MRKFVIAAIAIAAMASCSEEKFHIEGNITGAKDSTLYLEHVAIDDIMAIDSVKLTEDGNFSFAGKKNPAPEFYRLRMANQYINLSIDSTETVTVKAAWPDMATAYDVEGSENCQKIKQLSLLLIALRQQLETVSRDATLDVDARNDSLLAMITAYKENIKRNYIFNEPAQASAYFALFQTLGNMLIFNPRTDKDDIKVFAAVATSWDTFYPGSERGENLHNIAIEGMKTMRIAEANANKTIDADKVTTSGVIDIALKDNHGKQQQLTSLKGKVVLLDFHLFGLKESPARILMLRELYNKYNGRGLEIYQVSLDTDEHFWKQQTEALPWICVRDENGLNAGVLSLYNVASLPEFFLIDRNNTLVSRSSQVSDLEKEIEKLL